MLTERQLLLFLGFVWLTLMGIRLHSEYHMWSTYWECLEMATGHPGFSTEEAISVCKEILTLRPNN